MAAGRAGSVVWMGETGTAQNEAGQAEKVE